MIKFFSLLLFSFCSIQAHWAENDLGCLTQIHHMKATGTHGPASSSANTWMRGSKDDSFLPSRTTGFGHASSGLPGISAPTTALAHKPAVKPQGPAPTAKKELRFGKIGDEVPWSSKSVRNAVKSLEMGQTEVRVASRMEAEELLLGKFNGQGFKNTTGMRPTEAKDLLGGKKGTYHWDIGKDAYPHGASHLQIHDFEKYVIRIYFPD